MSEITWQYLAGFTDGEGYFGIVGRGPRAQWGQINKELIFLIIHFLKKQGFHPHINVLSPKPPKRPNAMYMCGMSRRSEILALIDILYPLLILKKAQCDKIRNWCMEHPSKQNYDEIDKELLQRLILQNYSASHIAKSLGCERQKVYKYAKRYGIKLHPAGGRSDNGKRVPNVRW